MIKHLSKLKVAKPVENIAILNRPPNSLVELVNWVSKYIIVDTNYNSYLHSKICIENDFLDFCDASDITVECVFRDPVASWEGDEEETFHAQGVFKISTKSFDFYQSALFHKGNQFEDEVSFFVHVKDNDLESYLNLREAYDVWLRKRSRDTNEIYVVGGDSIPYSRDLDWKDVYLEQSLKDEIQLCIEGFLNSESIYARQKIPWKKGIIFHGDPGNGKTMTMNVLISKYDFKPVTIRGSVGNDTDELVEEAFSYAEEHGPSLLFLEDLPGLLQSLSL